MRNFHLLFEIRRSSGLSRKKAAQMSNLSENTIKSWESGKVDPGFSRLKMYLHIFEKYDLDISTEALWDNSFVKKSLSRNNQNTSLISNAVSEAAGLFINEKETMLQGLLDASPFNIFFKDDKNNYIRLNNRAAFEIGGNPSDFDGKNAYDLFSFEAADGYHKSDLKILESNKIISSNYEIIKKDSNAKILVHITKTPIIVRDNKKIILGVWNKSSS